MLGRWLALGTALLLGGCLCKDDHEVRDGFAPFAPYARMINACTDDATCAPLCVQVLGLPDTDEVVGCRVTSIAQTGVTIRAHYIVPGVCAADDSGDGWDDGWDDGGYDDGGDSGDDGSCDDGSCDGGSDDGSGDGCDDGSCDGGDDGGYGSDDGGDDGGYGDDGGDTGDDGGGDDGGGDDGGDRRGRAHAPATPAPRATPRR